MDHTDDPHPWIEGVNVCPHGRYWDICKDKDCKQKMKKQKLPTDTERIQREQRAADAARMQREQHEQHDRRLMPPPRTPHLPYFPHNHTPPHHVHPRQAHITQLLGQLKSLSEPNSLFIAGDVSVSAIR